MWVGFLQHERVFFESFTDEAFLEKLISFHSLEDVKGKDQYNPKRALMFKVRNNNYNNNYYYNYTFCAFYFRVSSVTMATACYHCFGLTWRDWQLIIR